MTPAETAILATYFFVLVILAVYGWHRYYLVYVYMRHKDRQPIPQGVLDALPTVTIQLPIYNEMYVADRLIDAVCQIDYPRELLEIQVLDDSTDETRSVAERAVRRNAAHGLDIKYIHRDDRTGYKAGALEAGMRVARGEYIAIFDADFVPPQDFLRRTIQFFAEPRIGMVQARWGHINQDYSLLTKIQSILLDGHFVLEHGGRNRAGHFFNFNGTAGIWRRAAILRRRRLAARYPDRGPRSELSRAASGLEVRLPARPHRAGRSAGRNERLQVTAAPVGEGLDPDLPQSAAEDSQPPTCRLA